MVAVLLDELADIYALQDQHRQAEALLIRAIGIDERVCSLEHPETIRLQCHLAHLYVDLGDIAQARPLYERILRITPRPNMSCLDDLYDFIQLCLRHDEDTQADAFMQHVLTLVEPGWGSADEQLVSHCYDLAHLYQKQRRYAQAEALYQRALPKAEHVTLSYLDTAMILSDLAHLYVKQRRYTEAEPLYQRALALREQTPGLDNPAPAALRQDLLQLYLAQKNDVEAERMMRQILEVEELEFGPGHPDLIPTLNTLAHFYAQRHKYAEAAHLFKRIVLLYEHQAEPDALSLFVTLINLVGLAITR